MSFLKVSYRPLVYSTCPSSKAETANRFIARVKSSLTPK
jgi:hypothetical protein